MSVWLTSQRMEGQIAAVLLALFDKSNAFLDLSMADCKIAGRSNQRVITTSEQIAFSCNVTTIICVCLRLQFKGTSRGLDALQTKLNDSYYKSMLWWPYPTITHKRYYWGLFGIKLHDGLMR